MRSKKALNFQFHLTVVAPITFGFVRYAEMSRQCHFFMSVLAKQKKDSNIYLYRGFKALLKSINLPIALIN